MKPLPTLSGTQYPGAMPWGTNVATNRGFGVAAVCASSGRGRHHRVQQRQGERHAGAAQEGPPGDVLLRDKHGFLFVLNERGLLRTPRP